MLVLPQEIEQVIGQSLHGGLRSLKYPRLFCPKSAGNNEDPGQKPATTAASTIPDIKM
jgi:hypothetical protein